MKDKDFAVIRRQALFCSELMKRLDDDICFSKISYGSIEKHTAMQNDIVRLRRELLALSKMLDPWSNTK